MSGHRQEDAGLPPWSPVHRRFWEARQAGSWVDPQVRALRIAGDVDQGRFFDAIEEVVAALPVLRTGYAANAGVDPCPVARAPLVLRHEVSGAPEGQDAACLALLDADRRRGIDASLDPLVRFHLIRRAPGDVVLAVVADPLALDVRSVYLVLGAVLQSVLGRFRVTEYPAVTFIPPRTAMGTPRWRWWSARLASWHVAPTATSALVDRSRPAGDRRTVELVVDMERWGRLTGIAENAGNAATLSVVALLTWWLRDRSGPAAPVVLGGTLDLRELWGLGDSVGSLTERVLFDVDYDGLEGLSFAHLVRRVHAGLLDSVVHHVPFQELEEMAAAAGLPAPGGLCDVLVHYCRTPPASDRSRGAAALASLGLSVELFCESALVRSCRPPGVRAESPPVELHVAEYGDGMAIVLDYDSSRVDADDVSALLSEVAELADHVTARPGVPSTR